MKKILLATTILASVGFAGHAVAGDGVVKIGVLNDQSTSFSAIGGTEVVKAVELAIKDFGGQALGKPIEMISADHQNKPDVGLAIAREWFDTGGVDAIADMANSAISLGVNTLIGERDRVGLFVSPLTDRPTEADCNGHVVAWAYDAYSTVGTTVQALLGDGGKSFFILSPDYEAGKVQEAMVEKGIVDGGGEVKGKIRAPLGTTDFSSYLLQAQASGAEALILNVSGPELVNTMKQIQEFGLIDSGMKVAVTFMHQSDVRSIGTEALQGVRFSAPWVWTKDDASREFGKRMMEITGNAPGWIAAGTYSAVTNYLKAVEKAGTDDAKPVLKALQEIEIEDFFVQNGKLYPNGRLIHDMYLVEVKAPGDVKEKDDFFNVAATIPAEQAFRPYEATACTVKLGE
jgi:branched-chain amino acid transport system substrate-binding protein